MSYWEIWDSFTKVKQNWDQNRDLLVSLIDFLNQKVSIEKDYASGLNKLSKSSLFTKGKNSIEGCIRRLEIQITQQHSNLLTRINQQQTDLLPDLKTMIAIHDEALKAKARQCRDFELELKKVDQKVEKAKDFYLSSCDLCASPGDKEDFAEGKYREAVDDGNRFLQRYEENMKPVFELIQKHDDEKFKNFEETLRKFLIFEMAHVRSIQYELELIPAEIDLISGIEEKKKFIYDSLSERPFKFFSFETHPKKERKEMMCINKNNCKEPAMQSQKANKNEKCEKAKASESQKDAFETESASSRKSFLEKLQVKKAIKEFLMT